MADTEFTTEELAREEWRPIVGWEGRYSVSSLGRLRSEDRTTVRSDGRVYRYLGKPIRSRPNKNRRGYRFVILTLPRKGASKTRWVHRLVAEAFLGPLRPGDEVNHLDFDTANNRLANLCIGDHRANVAHTVRADRHLFGAKAPWAKLTESDVRRVFSMRTAGVSQAAIGRAVGVCPSQVWRILRGIRWARFSRDMMT